ncbi:MAG: O-antigen ligase family protein [Acidobacteria bacterium]|nr:O-antigen ligase family protein [Acidobacteriota bacterium]
MTAAGAAPSTVISPTSSTPTAQPVGWLLVAAIALLPIQFELSAEFRLAPTDIFVAAYIGLRLRSFRHLGKAWSSWHLLLFVTIFYGAAVAFVATGQVSQFAFPTKTIGVMQLFAIVFASLDYSRTFGDLTRLVRTFVGSATVITAVSIVVLYMQSAGTVELSRFNLDAARLSGLLVDPNAMGGLIGTALALLVVTAAARQPLMSRPITIAAALILSVGLFQTYSRSAWLGTGFGLIAGAVLLRGPIRRRLALIAFVGVAAGLTVFLLSSADSDVNRLASRGDQASERVSIAGDAFADFVGSPLFGTGLGTSEGRHGLQIHNTTIWFLAEMGPIGLLSIIGLITVLALWAMRSSRTATAPIAAVAAAALVAHLTMFGVSMGIEALYQRHWWFVWAVIGWCHAYEAADDGGGRPVLRRREIAR